MLVTCVGVYHVLVPCWCISRVRVAHVLVLDTNTCRTRDTPSFWRLGVYIVRNSIKELICLFIFQFNEEARSPFVKKYKTIIHPGEV